MSCGVGCRCSLDPELLWLWRRLAATALIRPLAWEPTYAMDAALKKQKDKKKMLRVYYNLFRIVHTSIFLEEGICSWQNV